MNLTRIVDRAQAEVQHVGDALTLLPFLPDGPHRLAEVGSGGGVPGMILAIARPQVQVTLIESTRKKARFLGEAVQKLGLKNVQIVDERAEDAGRQTEHRESYDVVTARAVATMNWLVEWCLPLVKKGGKFLALKGPKVMEELAGAKKALKLTGGGEPVVHAVELPGTEHRVIVQVPKVGRSDARYPRAATEAKGKPLS